MGKRERCYDGIFNGSQGDAMTQPTPPELIKAKKVLDKILAIKPEYEVGEFPPTEELAAKKASEVYYKRMMVIYLELVNTACDARSEYT